MEAIGLSHIERVRAGAAWRSYQLALWFANKSGSEAFAESERSAAPVPPIEDIF